MLHRITPPEQSLPQPARDYLPAYTLGIWEGVLWPPPPSVRFMRQLREVERAGMTYVAIEREAAQRAGLLTPDYAPLPGAEADSRQCARLVHEDLAAGRLDGFNLEGGAR